MTAVLPARRVARAPRCVECGLPIQMVEPRCSLRLRAGQPQSRHIPCHELAVRLGQFGLSVAPGTALLVFGRLHCLASCTPSLVTQWDAPWLQLDAAIAKVRALMRAHRRGGA